MPTSEPSSDGARSENVSSSTIARRLASPSGGVDPARWRHRHYLLTQCSLREILAVSKEMSMEVDEELDADSRIAMRQAAAYLESSFQGVFNKETIQLFLESSFHEFARQQTAKWIQVAFAEKFAKQRLKALARVEAPTERQAPAVLFLCVRNAGRSQMALGWFTKLAGDRAIGWSGGSEPGAEVNRAAVRYGRGRDRYLPGIPEALD